jgi:hypothetical protein
MTGRAFAIAHYVTVTAVLLQNAGKRALQQLQKAYHLPKAM